MRPSSGQLIAGALAAGFINVASLVLPWFDIVGRPRSSIDILRSASALDVIEGGLKIIVVGAWLLAPILVAGAMLLGAAGRHKIAAALLLPVGFFTLFAVGAGLFIDEIGVVWGAFLGLVSALLASILAIMVLMSPRSVQTVSVQQ